MIHRRGVADCGKGIIDLHTGSFNANSVLEPGSQIRIHVLCRSKEGLIACIGTSGFNERIQKKSKSKGCCMDSGVGMGNITCLKQSWSHLFTILVGKSKGNRKGDASGTVGVYPGTNKIVSRFHAFACGVDSSVRVTELVEIIGTEKFFCV